MLDDIRLGATRYPTTHPQTYPASDHMLARALLVLRSRAHAKSAKEKAPPSIQELFEQNDLVKEAT